MDNTQTTQASNIAKLNLIKVSSFNENTSFTKNFSNMSNERCLSMQESEGIQKIKSDKKYLSTIKTIPWSIESVLNKNQGVLG